MRDPRKKIRPDDVLGNLPDDVQASIYGWLKVPGNSLAKGVQWVREQHALETSVSSLSRFYQKKSREEWQDMLLKTSASTKLWIEKADQQLPQTSRGLANNLIQKAAELQMSGAPVTMLEPLVEMSMKIIEQMDRSASVQTDRAKFEVRTCELFLQWMRDERAKKIADSDAPNSEKISQLRQTYFADVDELEKSGEVQLPQ